MKLSLITTALSAIYASGALAEVNITYTSGFTFGSTGGFANQTVEVDNEIHDVVAKFPVQSVSAKGFGVCTFRAAEGNYALTVNVRGPEINSLVLPPQVLSNVTCGGPL